MGRTGEWHVARPPKLGGFPVSCAWGRLAQSLDLGKSCAGVRKGRRSHEWAFHDEHFGAFERCCFVFFGPIRAKTP